MLQEDNIKIFASFCYDYFEDLLAPVTFAKHFGFLDKIFEFVSKFPNLKQVSKIFVIKNALAINSYVFDAINLQQTVT